MASMAWEGAVTGVIQIQTKALSCLWPTTRVIQDKWISVGRKHFHLSKTTLNFKYILLLMLFNYCINLLRFRDTVLKKKEKNTFLISVFFFCIVSSWDIRGFIW